MGQLYLICVGKLKNKNYREIESDFTKRMNPSLQVIEVKSCAENPDKESEVVLKKISDLSKKSKAKIILLTEDGEKYSSLKFSKYLEELMGQSNDIFFCIGGAAGHGEKLLELADGKLSLSPLTFPHKLARLIIVEQLYRAQTISSGHPYHNE